jgi:hypothetical protein
MADPVILVTPEQLRAIVEAAVRMQSPAQDGDIRQALSGILDPTPE